jgi:hypothetical protein
MPWLAALPLLIIGLLAWPRRWVALFTALSALVFRTNRRYRLDSSTGSANPVGTIGT